MRAFFDLDEESSRYQDSRVAVLPVPYERTTSYGRGTERGPAAIHRASLAVELWDEELLSEPFRLGVATLAPLDGLASEPQPALRQIGEAALPHLEAGKFLVALGGEHALTLPLVEAAARVHGDIGVVQLDAHADLRDTYEGTPFSHACVMRRIRDLGLPTLALGIRSLSAEEAPLAGADGHAVVWGHELPGLTPEALGNQLDRLPESVYLTLDVDYFDSSLMPATGTPEPGGGTWHATLHWLRMLFARRRVVAMDVVELAPIDGLSAADFTVARLIYKCLGYLQASGRSR